jgi:CHAT domain-containing protein/tetratricopeptide (TPR) repeat protein
MKNGSGKIYNLSKPPAVSLRIIAYIAICVSTLLLSKTNGRAEQTVSSEILPDSPLTVRVNAGHKSTLHFRIASNRFFRILVQDAQTEVSLSLYAPDNRLNRSTGCGRGSKRISEIAKTAGEYRLELTSCDQSNGGYEVRLTAPKAAVKADLSRTTAERAFEDGDRLVRAGPGQRSTALLKYQQALGIWRAIGDRVEEMRTLQSAGTLHRDSGNSREALEYFESALELAKAEKLEIDRAEILRAIGTVHFRNGNPSRALEYCSRALEISRSVSDQNGIAEGMVVDGDVHYQITGDFNKAADAYSQAYAIWTALHYRRGQAQSLLYLAQLDSDRNEFKQAFDRGQQARSLFEDMGDDLGRAKSSALLGHVLSSTGRKQEALDLFEESRSVLSGDLASEATLMNSIALVHADLGDYESALPFSKRALENYATLGDRVAETFTLQEMGLYYIAAGDLANAQRVLERSLKSFQTLSNTRSETQSWLALGKVYHAMGKRQMALDSLNRSLKMSRISADRRLEASALLGLGRLQDSTGENQPALRYYHEALGLYKATEDRFGEIAALYHIARWLQRTGEITQAAATSEAAIEIIEKLRTSLASSGLRTFYFASAQQHFDVYIDSLMRMRTGADTSKAFEVSERARARTLLDSIGGGRLSISEGVSRDLFQRETSLRAVINAKSERYTQSLSKGIAIKELETLSDELRRLNAEYEELQGQIKIRNPHYAALVQPRPLGLQEIQQQVLDDQTVLLEYSLGDERSYLWAISQTSMNSYELPGRAEIEQATRGVSELLTARQPKPGETVQQHHARFTHADAQYWGKAASLSETLLGPVAAQLGTKRLLIVGEGALQYLPFGALPVPKERERGKGKGENEGQEQRPPLKNFKPLIVEHEIVSLPSASVMAVLRRETQRRQPRAKTVAIIADPVFETDDPRLASEVVARLKAEQAKKAKIKASGTGQPKASSFLLPTSPRTGPVSRSLSAPGAGLHGTFRDVGVLRDGLSFSRLLFSGREAEAIMAVTPPGQRMMATGFDANRALAISPELSQYRIVHFATHGVLNDQHPGLSGVILSLVDEQGRPQDGFLRLHDIYNLKLPADLVVLSACNTALGKDVRGEGLVGIVRGFMYAGAARVVASLWKVDDEATAELMKRFYRHMLQREKMPAAAALRAAQVEMWQQKQWQSPYFWAAFSLQGEWK